MVVKSCVETFNAKPILRPLSDMTRQEKDDCPKLLLDKWGAPTIESIAIIVNYLRGIHIDCDGLIESGQPIDKTKMQ